MRKRMLLNDFSEITFEKDKAILSIDGKTILEIGKNNGFLLTTLDESNKEEVGIGVAFHTVAEDERESLPFLFSYYISKERKTYRLIPLLSSVHLGCAAGWFFLLRGLEQNRDFVVDSLKLATISYGWSLDKATIDLSQAEAIVNAYLFQKFGREAIPYIVQQEINKIKALQLKRIENFQRSLLNILVEKGMLKGDRDLVALHNLENIAEELGERKREIQEAHKKRVIIQYAISVRVSGIPVLIHLALFWDGQMVKIRMLLVVPSKNLPSPEEVVRVIKDIAKGDKLIEVKLINHKGRLVDVEVPTPMYQMVMKVINEYCKRISVAPEVLENK